MSESPQHTPQHSEGSLADRLARLQLQIQSAAESCGRDPSTIRLIAVSKGQSVERIREAYDLGQRDFGENYVQEWLQKKHLLQDLTDLRWHFIGHLQSNKVKFLTDGCYNFQSIDRPGIVEILERKLILANSPNGIRALLQLEIDPQDTGKHGLKLKDVERTCELLSGSSQLHWDGFMGMGPADKEDEELLDLYEKFTQTARELWTRFHPKNPSLSPILSLGISSDLNVAIKAGSTMVRVGTALFGARPQKTDEPESSGS